MPSLRCTVINSARRVPAVGMMLGGWPRTRNHATVRHSVLSWPLPPRSLIQGYVPPPLCSGKLNLTFHHPIPSPSHSTSSVSHPVFVSVLFLSPRGPVPTLPHQLCFRSSPPSTCLLSLRREETQILKSQSRPIPLTLHLLSSQIHRTPPALGPVESVVFPPTLPWEADRPICSCSPRSTFSRRTCGPTLSNVRRRRLTGTTSSRSPSRAAPCPRRWRRRCWPRRPPPKTQSGLTSGKSSSPMSGPCPSTTRTPTIAS